jgi:Leucine-rich repeat (LRR) protein
MDKPKEIIDLENALGIKLKELKDGEIMQSDNHYQLDEAGILIGLNLSDNQLTDITPLKDLTSLTFLDLRQNQLTDITPLSKLTSLTSLDLSQNQLTDITPLAALTSLTSLDLGNNRLTDIASLAELPSLNNLKLGSDNIYTYTFGKHTVSTIDMRNNHYLNIAQLSLLKSLKTLHLGAIGLKDISPLHELPFLTELNVKNNDLSDIRAFEKLLNLESLTKLHASNNPFAKSNNLILPTFDNHLEIIKIALEKIKEAEELDAPAGYLPLKVLMLGNHGSGKSSLVHYLNTNNLKITHDTTHILSIKEYKRQKNNKLPIALFYDFGGQDFYHGLYQAFLSQKAMSVLLWRKDKDRNEKDEDIKQRAIRNFKVPYWLGLLKRNRISDNIFVIRTHKTKGEVLQSYANSDVKEEFFLDLAKEETLEIADILKSSSLTYFKNVFDEYIEDSQKQQDIDKPEKSRGKLSKKFYDFLIKIRKEGNKAKGNPKNISEIKSWYLDIDDSRFEVEIEQLVLSGMILKYKDMVWLNPQALVNKVHKIFLTKVIGKGIIEETRFNKLLSDQDLIGLLSENKVIFKHEHGEINEMPITEYIIPNYLPLIESSGIDYDLMVFGMDNPLFVLKYQDYMPFGLINHLICHFGRNPDRKKFWRDQLVFTISENDPDDKLLHQAKILIKLNFDDLKIEVYAYFKNKENSSFKDELNEYIFYSILSFDSPSFMPYSFQEYKKSREDYKIELNTNFTNEGREKVFTFLDCPKNGSEERSHLCISNHNLYISLDNKSYIQHIDLLGNGSKAFIDSYYEDLSFYKVQAAYLYQPFTPSKIEKMKKVFISYSKDDLDLVMSFINSLQSLVIEGTIDQPWYCTYLQPGDEVHNKIRDKMAEADIVCFMCSNNFYKTYYIIENELKPTIKRYIDGGKQIIVPIIIDRCKWIIDKDEVNLGKFSGFPYRGKPVSSFFNWNDAWYVTNYFLEIIIKTKTKNSDSFFNAITNLPSDIQELLQLQVKGELNK